MKKIAILFFALMLFAAVNARELQRTEIELQLDSSGTAHVAERYYYGFDNPFDLNDFKQIVEKKGSSLLAWKAFDSSISPHFCREQSISNAEFSFDEGQGFLRLEYDCSEQIAAKASEDSRATYWALQENQFSEFGTGSLIVIPSNTTVWVILPQNAEFIGEVLPSGEISSNQVKWQGYLPTTRLLLEYKINKPIAPPIETTKLLQDFFANRMNWIFILVLAVIVALVYWKRERIGKKIEDYIVEHSEITQKSSEEETKVEA